MEVNFKCLSKKTFKTNVLLWFYSTLDKVVCIKTSPTPGVRCYKGNFWRILKDLNFKFFFFKSGYNIKVEETSLSNNFLITNCWINTNVLAVCEM